MTKIPSHFKFLTDGSAHPEAVVHVPGIRVTVLTSRLLRLEFSAQDRFEDRPTQIFWFRNHPVPEYSVAVDNNAVEVQTNYLHLRYKPEKQLEPFSFENLSIVLKETGAIWEYGMEDRGNLGGTLRTLDMIDGSAPIEPGLISRSGWSVVDDTHGLVFNQQGWVEARNDQESYKDLYFFGYGIDYKACLQDFFKLSGKPGFVPRWALGNWWSRYWEYTDQELRDLLLDFRSYETPLSVCIIDMDWHITKTGNQSSGWTGYTWNKELFPRPAETVKFIHDMGLKTGLNLHPAQGIYPHEEMYPQMAAAMGIDPDTKEPVQFDLENPDFIVPYFSYLHHPQETEIGIDFWWMDWQQGNPTRLPGLNLLWWINHIHYFDLGRHKDKRPFIFSRWGGLGNHRYPIGFSGDTVISWASLAFQPYLTATAANVGYGWWSHDIGGHMGGITDGELYTRWVQFGVFSPIMRFHSTKNPFLERRPWGYDREILHVVKQAMQLRHKILPYTYSMAWRDHVLGISLIRPMYYEFPELDQAYACPNQYYFGSEMIAAPYIAPIEPDIGLARQVVWFPKGVWFDFFSGKRLDVGNEAGAWKVIYGKLSDIPVYAKAGAIIPLSDHSGWESEKIPHQLTIRIFAGQSNSFELYEDDGESSHYQDGSFAITKFTQKWEEDLAGEYNLEFTIHPVEGKTDLLSDERSFNFEFIGIGEPRNVAVTFNGKLLNEPFQLVHTDSGVVIEHLPIKHSDSVAIKLTGSRSVNTPQLVAEEKTVELTKLINSFKLNNNVKVALLSRFPSIIQDIQQLAIFKASLAPAQMKALLEILSDAGIEYITNTGREKVVIWNNGNTASCSWMYTTEQHFLWHMADSTKYEQGTLPYFRVIDPKSELEILLRDRTYKITAVVQVDYGSLLRGRLILNSRTQIPENKIGWL